MKKLLILATCFLLLAGVSNAQRYAVIDSKYILDKLPEYKEAQKLLDQFSEQWQQEIDQKQALVDKMFKDYDAELIKPIQDRVYNAVQKLAVEKQYDFILDKSEGITVIFADPKLDKSADIIRNLGVK